jgi:hypothetical protein
MMLNENSNGSRNSILDLVPSAQQRKEFSSRNLPAKAGANRSAKHSPRLTAVFDTQLFISTLNEPITSAFVLYNEPNTGERVDKYDYCVVSFPTPSMVRWTRYPMRSLMQTEPVTLSQITVFEPYALVVAHNDGFLAPIIQQNDLFSFPLLGRYVEDLFSLQESNCFKVAHKVVYLLDLDKNIFKAQKDVRSTFVLLVVCCFMLVIFLGATVS